MNRRHSSSSCDGAVEPNHSTNHMEIVKLDRQNSGTVEPLSQLEEKASLLSKRKKFVA